MSTREATSKEGTDMNKRTNLLAVITSDPSVSMPEGFDTWGVKSVYPDLITTRGFQWALPGGVNVSNDALIPGNTSACPNRPGDGLCVATTWRGMASGGIPARTLLLVAYRESDIVGRDEAFGNFRIGGPVASVELVDGCRLIRERGAGMSLEGADLWGANLWCADLEGADLRGANLEGANLRYANLRGADLRSANLRSANLRHADLRHADLRHADLRSADLRSANLERADLHGDTASVTVRFLAEFRSRTKSAEGEAVDDKRTAELWTFERNVKSRDPNWLLVHVDAAEA